MSTHNICLCGEIKVSIKAPKHVRAVQYFSKTLMMWLKTVSLLTNSAVPDQMHSLASDLGQYSLVRPFDLNT